LIERFIESNIFFALIGKFFQVDGARYEGEFKEGMFHGQGKNKLNMNNLLILIFFDVLIGKLFYNNGDKYEGEF